MQIVIEIPDNEIPTRQEIVEVEIHFIDGKVCECTYPFQELPKNHGRLIDADELELDADWDAYYDGYFAYSQMQINNAPTIIEEVKVDE